MFKVEAGETVRSCQDDKPQRKPRFLSASAEGRSTHTATVTLPFSLRSPNREQIDGPFPRGKDGRAESGTRSQGDGTWEPWRSVDETVWDPAVQAQEETSPLPPWVSCTPAGFMELGWSQEGRWAAVQKEHQATACR